jgi:hypothetical protein
VLMQDGADISGMNGSGCGLLKAPAEGEERALVKSLFRPRYHQCGIHNHPDSCVRDEGQIMKDLLNHGANVNAMMWTVRLRSIWQSRQKRYVRCLDMAHIAPS